MPLAPPAGPTPRSDETPPPETAWAALAAMPDLCFVIDAAGRYLTVSRPDHPLLAAPWSEVRGRHFADVVPESVAALANDALRRARASGRVERIEYRLRTMQGRDCAFEARVVAMDDGKWLFIIRDVTELAEAQQALSASESRYARTVRGLSDGLWEWDIDSGQAYLSPRWKELLGFGDHRLDGHIDSFFGRMHPEDAGPTRAAIQAHLRYGAPFDVELRLETRDAGFRWFRARGQAEHDRAGRPVRMSGGISDINVRKQTEQALRDSQAKFSALFHTAPVGIGVTDVRSGRVVDANEEMARMLGWTVDEMLGRTGLELGVWASAELREAMLAGVEAQPVYTVEHLVMQHRDGSDVHGRLAVHRLDLDGQSLLVSAVTDIGARLRAEASLQEQKEAYAAIFHAASDAIISVDTQGRIRLFNPAAERIFGHPAADVIGQPLDMLLPEGHAARHADDLSRFARSAITRRPMAAGRVQGRHADGRLIQLEASISQAAVGGRQVLTAILRDVTERVQAETAARRHQDELSALTRRLTLQEKLTTERLAQSLHDHLGQTLTGLRLAVDRMMRDPVLSASDAGQGLHGLVQPLIDQSMTELRRFLVELRPPLLAEEGLFAALDNELSIRAQRHPEIDLILDAGPATQLRRWPNEVEYALFMIAREAVDNALRHARASLVRVALDSDEAQLLLEVSDDGIGLPPQAQSPAGHLGLVGMRERARSIDAVLRLGPGGDGGTQVLVEWHQPS